MRAAAGPNTYDLDSRPELKDELTIHVVGKTDTQAGQMLKEETSPIADGFRLIQHGPDTQTQGAHLHLDSENDKGNPTDFMHEGMTPAQKSIYSHDEDHE